jgi:hypothetical protein
MIREKIREDIDSHVGFSVVSLKEKRMIRLKQIEEQAQSSEEERVKVKEEKWRQPETELEQRVRTEREMERLSENNEVEAGVDTGNEGMNLRNIRVESKTIVRKVEPGIYERENSLLSGVIGSNHCGEEKVKCHALVCK